MEPKAASDDGIDLCEALWRGRSQPFRRPHSRNAVSSAHCSEPDRHRLDERLENADNNLLDCPDAGRRAHLHRGGLAPLHIERRTTPHGSIAGAPLGGVSPGDDLGHDQRHSRHGQFRRHGSHAADAAGVGRIHSGPQSLVVEALRDGSVSWPRRAAACVGRAGRAAVDADRRGIDCVLCAQVAVPGARPERDGGGR